MASLTNKQRQEKQLQFLRLRIEGKSYRAIEDEISINRTSLMQWGKLYANEIKAAQLAQVQSVIDEANYNVAVRLKKNFDRLHKIEEAIDTRTDSGLDSLKDLYQIRETIVQEIGILRRRISFESDILQDQYGQKIILRGDDEL